jgi:membrane protease YdiL (CAAX protease family)
LEQPDPVDVALMAAPGTPLAKACALLVLGTIVLALGDFAVRCNQPIHAWLARTAGVDAGSLPFYLVCIAFGLVYARAFPRDASTPWRPGWTGPRKLAIGVAIAALSMYALPFFRLVTGRVHAPPSVLALLSGGLIGPFAEEWLFRGVLHERILRTIGGERSHLVAVVFGSLAFGFWHCSFEGWGAAGLGAVPVHAAFGALAAVLRWRVRGLLPGAVIHAVGNSVILLTM